MTQHEEPSLNLVQFTYIFEVIHCLTAFLLEEISTIVIMPFHYKWRVNDNPVICYESNNKGP